MFKRFISYYRPHKALFILDMTASLLIAVIGLGYPIITRHMLSTWVPEHDVKMIIIASFSLLGIYMARALLRYFTQYYGHVMGVRIQFTMREELFTKLQRLPFSYYDEHETGTILSTMTNDLFEISELAHHGPENILIASFTILGSLIYLILINWILGLTLILMIPILIFVTYYFKKKFHVNGRKSREATAVLNARTANSIEGIRVTKAFTNQKLEEEKFAETNRDFLRVRTDLFISMGTYFSISQFIADFFNVLVILFGGLLLYYYGVSQSQLADYSAFVVSISLFITPVNQLTNFMEQYESAASGFERFINVIDEVEETINDGHEILKTISGEIEFSHVTFCYQKNRKILDDVSFKIKKGQTLALVGPSGGGKTTICHLIPRFYFLNEMCSGAIYIDGRNINDFTLESLRKNIGIVQQDVYLFAGTIKENIRYGKPDATDEEIYEAAKKADIYYYVEALPEKWDTNIGERGSKLSGGQKQRIAIARIFLKNPPLLILDEATSALDNATEMIIQRALNKLSEGRTCLIVAHRLSTIKNADVIAVIDKGQISEMGPHEELIKNPKGVYHFLHELQFRLDQNKKDVHSKVDK
ncbi:MAG: ABC transporter ATP-binding protein/permease [Bacilli bacterium]|nr:ABC transporter ATP-binding protein/permease [Bacilli bacterium]